MAINTKRIEESATTALKSTFLRCRYIDAYIDSNDKTPSWDGTIFVYSNGEQKKEHLLGTVPIQVKGTARKIVSEEASFSCSVVDLKNYYRDGGCIFFLVSVDPSTQWYKIYYASLLTFDLDGILKKAKKQTTYTIKLKSFPVESEAEMANIFMDFVKDKPKQMSFIGKEIPSIESLTQNGTIIESLSFGTSGVGIKNSEIERYITNHDFYLYAKPKGLDIDIPVEKVFNPIISKEINGSVKVNDIEYYSSYTVVYEKGQATFQISKGLSFVPPYEGKNSKLQIRPAGTLSEFIKDTSFIVDVIDHKELSINGAKLPFDDLPAKEIKQIKSNFEYYKNVKKTLDFLGVREELNCDNLSEQDQRNIRNLVGAVLYGKKMTLSHTDAPVTYCLIKIANLSVLIWAEKQSDEKYVIKNFFEKHSVCAFDVKDVNHEKPMQSSQYLLLNKRAFECASNIDCEIIFEDLISTEPSQYLMSQSVLFLLEILKGYDKNPKIEFLNLATKILDWIEENNIDIGKDIILLNRMQILKRQRNLSFDELSSLEELKKDNKSLDIRCGAYLLLDDNINAQKCFDEMGIEMKKMFIDYPICFFGKLTLE